MSSSAQDSIGQGKEWHYDLTNASFNIDSDYSDGVAISLQGENYTHWNTNFAAPDGINLETGIYGFAERHPFQSPGTAGLSITGDGRGCNTLTGSFVVNKIIRDTNNKPRSFEAGFDQYCEGGSAVLSGTIAYNVRHESVPTAEAGELIEVNELGLVNLNGSDSIDPIGNITSYNWSNKTEDLIINNADQSRAYFIAPLLNNREASRLIPLHLLITDDESYQSGDWVNVKVVSANTPPVATDDSVTISTGPTITLTPLANDGDSDGTLLTDSINIITAPAYGNAIVNSDGSILYQPTSSQARDDTFTYTVKDNDGAVSNIATFNIQTSGQTNNDDEAKLIIRAFLQGAYDTANGLMRDTLRASGLLPLQQPYVNSVFDHQGSETLFEHFLAVEWDTAAVDWMLIELRDKDVPSTVVIRKAALIQRNGYLFDVVPGGNELSFPGLVAGSYFVALHHRNHLAVMTEQPIYISHIAPVVDFSLTNTAIMPGTSRYESDGVAMMWAGDINLDQRIISSGPGNDTSPILSTVLSDVGNAGNNNNFVVSGYHSSDLNLDGKTVFSGPGNDTSWMLQNTLVHPGNTNFAGNYAINGKLD